MKATIALVDDHVMLRNGLASLLRDLGYSIVFEADNGKQAVEKFSSHSLPQVVLMDISMPLMNGYETTEWLKKTHPSVHVLALSMLDDEEAIIRMLKCGAKGYLLKDSHPQELETAINAVLQKGFYHSELVSGKMMHAIHQENGNGQGNGSIRLTEKEREFLKWLCTDLSYKEIAEKMDISPRTADSYREQLQEKLQCKGRIAMVLWAIKSGAVTV